MNSSQDQYLRTADVQLRFVEKGEGGPVVLIHGFTGDIEMWTLTQTMDVLSENFHVIAMDCRGHGRSVKPHDTALYGMEMVTDVVRLLDWLDIGNAHLIGYSMGAEIALRLSVMHPARVRSLIIGGSGWSGRHDDENYQRIADSLEKSASFRPFILSMTQPGQPQPSQEEIAAADEILAGQDIKALAAAARATSGIINLTTDDLSGIGIPVLGIAGEHDPEKPNLEKMAGVVPNFMMKVVTGRDHMDAPADPQFNRSIIEFLSDMR